MRRNRRRRENACHIVSAWSREDGYSLGQKAVEEKSNEIAAIPELLDSIQVKGQIVTIDTMRTRWKKGSVTRQKILNGSVRGKNGRA